MSFVGDVKKIVGRRCFVCDHDLMAHYRMVDHDGELIEPEPCHCLECGCMADPGALLQVTWAAFMAIESWVELTGECAHGTVNQCVRTFGPLVFERTFDEFDYGCTIYLFGKEVLAWNANFEGGWAIWLFGRLIAEML